MKKNIIGKILPMVFGLGLLGISIFAISSCGAYYNLSCDVSCDSDYPYWGGGDICYASSTECEQYWDVCYDCSD
jgi:hypothetical protein